MTVLNWLGQCCSIPSFRNALVPTKPNMPSELELRNQTREVGKSPTEGPQDSSSITESVSAYGSPPVYSSNAIDSINPPDPQEDIQTGPLSLTLSKQIIYPTLPPARALHHLSLSLESTGHSITLSASIPSRINSEGTRLKARDRDLYIITRGIGFSIRSQSRTAYLGVGRLLFERHGFKGKRWELSYGGGADGKGKRDVVLKKKDGKWTDSMGAAVAEEEEENLAQIKDQTRDRSGEGGGSTSKNRILTIAEGVDERMKSLLVAVWCATIWYRQTYEELNGGMTKEDAARRLNTGQAITGGGGGVMKGYYAI
jgi:hypothetical protein